MSKALLIVISVLFGIVLSACIGSSSNSVVLKGASSIIGEDGKLKENIGLRSAGDLFTIILPKGANEHMLSTKEFSTAKDNQQSIGLTFYRGLSKMASENTLLGTYTISGIPKGSAMSKTVRLTLRIKGNEVVIEAVEKNSKIQLKVIGEK